MAALKDIIMYLRITPLIMAQLMKLTNVFVEKVSNEAALNITYI